MIKRNKNAILSDPSPRRARFSLSRSQWMWATMGVVTAITIAALAFANLREVYNSQKDFVVGLLASLAAVCFTKAFSRTRETHAVELIREDRPGSGLVAEALDGVVRKRLDRKGVFEATAGFCTATLRRRRIDCLSTTTPRLSILSLQALRSFVLSSPIWTRCLGTSCGCSLELGS
ncbi:hypothetical protein DMH04_32020 [Kibdelosporangium aridum]|uniref:Uncharacterized protein n=1 Tax=Kibdelosporangium aridum TaxID=2030 RepID=A0A428Z280_KIBAR|nr:hypothetical protein DMH04_32020 [Kibdelosporangium aridum]